MSFPEEEDPYVVTSLVIRFLRAIPEGVLNVRATQAVELALALTLALTPSPPRHWSRPKATSRGSLWS